MGASAKGKGPGRLAARFAIAIAVLAVWLVGASTAGAIRTEFFGVAQQQIDNRDAIGMRNAHVRTARFELGWRFLEPKNGTFNWTRSDDIIGTLASRGMRPLPFIWGSPKWVSSQPAIPPVGNAADEQAWQAFLAKVVARYGPGGVYWKNAYRRDYGANAKPRPIYAWQIWNEPNLNKFFNPGGTPEQSVQKYARLLRLSHDAIKGQSPSAQIVLAGNPGYPPSGGLKAWEFLDHLYRYGSVSANFDVAAIHPYASTLGTFKTEIQKMRDVLAKHNDAGTPLWITEFGWGSAKPDKYGINQGIAGQQRLLKGAIDAVLANRKAWNLQRMYWFLWRDPAPNSNFAHRCSFCGSAGLLKHDRSGKPAFNTFKGFTAEMKPPTASITAGPPDGALINNPTPHFSFVSNEAGSTFQCRMGSNPFKACSSPLTVDPLADGAHTFYVRAIDAPGNVSVPRARSFTVDTTPPAVPTITSTNPASPANNNSPKVLGNAAAGTTVKIFKVAGCTGTAVAKASAGQFKSPGITVAVPDNSTTSLRAKATDAAGNTSGCSAAFSYVEDSTP
ncbi:MAG: glycosyl hydrolase [Solirubrobacterales bacterium]